MLGILLGFSFIGTILAIVGMICNNKKQEKGEIIFITAEVRLIRFSISVVNKLIDYILGLVVKMLACCSGDPGFDPQVENPKFTFISNIPAGCHSDEMLNLLSFVPVSMLGK